MSDSPVTFALKEEHQGKSQEEQSALLDLEVENLSKFFETLDDFRARGALNKMERALVKTYMVQKLTGRV